MKKLYVVIVVPALIASLLFGLLGFAIGTNGGYQSGYANGTHDGYARGHSDGYSQGKQDGYAQGQSDGYTQGYAAAGGAIQTWISQNCMNYPFLLLDTNQYMACHRY